MKYVKKMAAVFAVLFMMIAAVGPVYAEKQISYVFDFDDSLSETEEEKLSDKINKCSRKFDMNIAIVITNDLEGKYSEEYADDFYDNLFGINTDGILLLMDNYSYIDHISTSGSAIKKYNDADINEIFEYITPSMKEHDYYSAADKFLDVLDTDVLKAEKIKRRIVKSALIGIICGLAVSLIVCGIIKHCYRSHQKVSARNYAAKNDIRFTMKNDRFLRQYTTKTKIETSSGGGGSSTHRSSSGGTHGGSSHHR